MTFYAHSQNGCGQCHGLACHLHGVGTLARRAARQARWAGEAELAGLLRDLGKYGDLFQAQLRGEEAGLDHWSAGVVVAATDPGLRALAAALAIEGHHSGLQAANPAAIKRRLRIENLRSNHPLRLRLTEVGVDRLRERAAADGLAFLPPADRVFGRPASIAHAAAAMLDVRMLFSCLVDADFLDTEARFEGDTGGKRYRAAGPALVASEALAALDQYVQAKVHGGSAASSEIAAARSALWRSVTSAARQQPGAFTLTAPTGSGKTLAMLKFALEHARLHGLRRIVLAVPFLSIIEQTARVYHDVFSSLAPGFVLEHHSLAGLGSIVEISSARGARRFADYSVTVHADRMPVGVELWRCDFTTGKLIKEGADS